MACVLSECSKELALAFGVLPLAVQPAVVETSGLGGHPDFPQGLLLVDNNLAAVREGYGYHAAYPLVVQIRIGFVVDAVTDGFHRVKQRFGSVHVFRISHYVQFFTMLIKQILVSAIIFGACISTLMGCGQTGALYLPALPKPDKPAASAPVALADGSYIFYS